MKTYQIKLTLTGTLTQLSDSQRLFGVLMWMFSEAYGKEETTEFVQAVLKEEVPVFLSNLIPYGYFPVPVEYLQSKFTTSLSDDKEKRSLLKERNYVNPKDLDYLLKHPNQVKNVTSYIKLAQRQYSRISLESQKHRIAGIENKLYSIPSVELILVEKERDEEVKSRVVIREFSFYLQTDESERAEKLVSMLRRAVREKCVQGLGQRASQGMNLYRFEEFLEESKAIESPAKNYLNLGMLLPEGIDFQNSFIKLFSSERRPYHAVGGWSEKFTGQFISFIAERSVLALKTGIRNSGKSIRSPYDNKAIVFGNSFLYPLNQLGGDHHAKVQL